MVDLNNRRRGAWRCARREKEGAVEFKTEKIAVVRLSELELARLMASHQLPAGLEGEAREFLERIQEERARADAIDGVTITPALTAGNGHEDLPATRRAMRKFHQATGRGKKKMRRARQAKSGEQCKYCGRPFKAAGWRVSH